MKSLMRLRAATLIMGVVSSGWAISTAVPDSSGNWAWSNGGGFSGGDGSSTVSATFVTIAQSCTTNPRQAACLSNQLYEQLLGNRGGSGGGRDFTGGGGGTSSS